MSATAPAATKPKRKRVRLEYNRQKQKEYRDRDKAEISELQKTFNRLQAVFHAAAAPTRSTTSLLPWRQVALAMLSACRDASSQNARLRVDQEMQQTVLHDLLTTMHIECPPTAPTFTWRNVTLTVNPDSRRMAFDWITTHLFHNTDIIFQRCQFPSALAPSEVLNDCLVDATDPDAMQYILRYQRVVHAPLVRVAASVRAMEASGDAIDSQLWPTQDANSECHFRYARRPGVYDLSREFQDVISGRHVMVTQNIHDDPTLAPIPIQRNRMSWVVLEPRGEHTTCLRLLSIQSHHFDQTGAFLALDDEARRWGCDAQHLHGFVQHMNAVTHRYIADQFTTGLT
ncbi:Aste57867_13 [Aphanomyces stellatus]|uniref:Aste57867_13 protein n=1 Tax=Aphanomyces stellatus TaxID=120398 RepID=A0A485K1Q1_9STRA|nr:hypothetical protein As57867_000013 [Aphanomyces stellatus]VFT77239.1 Aste57867_13 [Aphanomyces stellatus]